MKRGRHRASRRLLPHLLEVVGAEELDQLQAVWFSSGAG
jgi:hypothetical protein